MLYVSLLLFSACGPIFSGADGLSSKNLDVYESFLRQNRQKCGPVALWYCLRRWGKDADVEQIVRQAHLSENGISLQDLLALAAGHGMSAQAIQCDLSRLEDLPVPAIVVAQSMSHCVVYEGTDPEGREAFFFEPNEGRIKSMPVEQFRQQWRGQAIIFEKPQLSRAAFRAVIVLVALAVVLMGWLVDGWRSRRRDILPVGLP